MLTREPTSNYGGPLLSRRLFRYYGLYGRYSQANYRHPTARVGFNNFLLISINNNYY